MGAAQCLPVQRAKKRRYFFRFGIEADGRDHDAIKAMVARVVQKWGRVDVLVANAGGGRGRPMDTKASSLDPAPLTACHGDEPVRDRLFVQRGRPDHEAAPFGQNYHGEFSGRDGTSHRRRLCSYGAAKAAIAHYTRYPAQDLGPFGITQTNRSRRDRDRADHSDGDYGSIQSNRDRAELVALGTVGLCQGGRVPGLVRLIGRRYGVVIPIDGGLVRG